MKKVIIKKSRKQGKGLFAGKDFKKGEKILHVDLRKLRSHTLEEWKNIPGDDSHLDYVGRGKYVLTFLPYSYINHSCEPNAYIIHKTIAISNVHAMRDIKKGEEISVDYGVNNMHFEQKEDFPITCKCGSKNCRKKISMFFFRQPLAIQKKYYKFLPLSIRRKYKGKLR